MKADTMSRNIVNTITTLSRNEGIARLLLNEGTNPFTDEIGEIRRKNLIKVNHVDSRIYPYPFDPEATIEDSAFIRVYYNDADFDKGEIISESNIHIDIVVAKSMWLIDNGVEPMIRPYEILGRVIDSVGRRSVGKGIKLQIEGIQHLAVNGKFDAIRIYCNYMSVEALKHSKDGL